MGAVRPLALHLFTIKYLWLFISKDCSLLAFAYGNISAYARQVRYLIFLVIGICFLRVECVGCIPTNICLTDKISNKSPFETVSSSP